jgi:hypothetical protein
MVMTTARFKGLGENSLGKTSADLTGILILLHPAEFRHQASLLNKQQTSPTNKLHYELRPQPSYRHLIAAARFWSWIVAPSRCRYYVKVTAISQKCPFQGKWESSPHLPLI